MLGGHICIWGESFDSASLPMLAFQVSMGAAENFWGKWGGNGDGQAADSTPSAVHGADSSVPVSVSSSSVAKVTANNESYWWKCVRLLSSNRHLRRFLLNQEEL